MTSLKLGTQQLSCSCNDLPSAQHASKCGWSTSRESCADSGMRSLRAGMSDSSRRTERYVVMATGSAVPLRRLWQRCHYRT